MNSVRHLKNNFPCCMVRMLMQLTGGKYCGKSITEVGLDPLLFSRPSKHRETSGFEHHPQSAFQVFHFFSLFFFYLYFNLDLEA